MLNNFVIVGKLVHKDALDNTITISLENETLLYTELLVVCSQKIFQNINEHVNLHELLGIKGHFETHPLLGKGTPCADKVTFLSCKGGEE